MKLEDMEKKCIHANVCHQLVSWGECFLECSDFLEKPHKREIPRPSTGVITRSLP